MSVNLISIDEKKLRLWLKTIEDNPVNIKFRINVLLNNLINQYAYREKRPNQIPAIFKKVNMPVLKYVKKPVVIEAIQWDGTNRAEIEDFFDKNRSDESNGSVYLDTVRIRTLEGVMEANVNDWIIKGVTGELYPCKPDIFKMTYDSIG